MIYPEFPSEGDVIGICAPSAGVGGKIDSFDLSIETLNEAGFVTCETESVRNDDCPSAEADIRGYEFNELFEDDDIAAVICASGGEYTAEMLPYIDEELVRSHPKWFSGYSDPTAIEMLMTTVYDIATIYGPNAGAWDWRPLHEYQENSLSLLYGDIPVQHSYDMWAGSGINEETGEYELDTPVEWSLFLPFDGELCEASMLDVRGRLIGGCTDVLDDIIGTPFEDLKGFAERYKKDGLIWFFDDFAMNPQELMYLMLKMKYIGLFDNARAILFGRVCFPGEADDVDYLEQLERVFRDTRVPLIWGADIGHTKPSFTLINGALAHLTFEDGYAELSMFLE
jgi:muramoyltetrapeptide carboxypeptidase LdcA involved in peptidoglycan recycling